MRGTTKATLGSRLATASLVAMMVLQGAPLQALAQAGIAEGAAGEDVLAETADDLGLEDGADDQVLGLEPVVTDELPGDTEATDSDAATTEADATKNEQATEDDADGDEATGDEAADATPEATVPDAAQPEDAANRGRSSGRGRR